MPELSRFVRKDFKPVDKRDALHAVKGWLTGDSTKVPIVLDDGKPFGIVNERALMGRSLDLDARVHKFTLATKPLTENSSTKEAIERLARYRAAYLPVEDERGKPAGYVRALDLAHDAVDGRSARELAVPVTQLREEQTIGDALHAFTKEYVEFLPVLGERGRLTGVLRRSDVLKVEFNAGDRGRRDAGGEKVPLLDGAIAGYMDEVPRLVPPDADGASVLSTLDHDGYAFVASADSFLGIVTPETLFRDGGR